MKKTAFVVLAAVLAVYLWNASWLAPAPVGEMRLIAHRGVHHGYDRTGLDNDTCTAQRIFPPRHDLFENSIASMQAAFAAGADVVEIDVQPTTDGRFAVFHDWTLDCRTEGTGDTRSHDLATLQALDIGYGYTADGGRTYPLRGKGTGRMPSLDEVLETMPDRRFLVNFKSREAREGTMLADLVTTHPQWAEAVWGAYGGDEPTLAAKRLMPQLNVWTRRGLVDCITTYAGLGWSGYVPEACRDTYVMVPINVAPWLWGWPNRFLQRVREAGSEVILLGAYGQGDPGTAGVDDAEAFARVPPGFDGYVWTNRIELIGPLRP